MGWFGKWLGLEEIIARQQVQIYLKNKWKRLQHIAIIENTREVNNSFKANSMNFTTTSCKILEEVKELKFQFIGKPKCITNLNGQALVHLEQLNNDDVII